MEPSSDETCTSAHRVFSIEDLLSKILAGIPFGSLRLSKSVCKRWLHLISGPSFNALRSRSPKADHPCFLLVQVFSVFDHVPLAAVTSIERPLISSSFPFYAENLEVLQSCNGLLLCYDHQAGGKFYVYNPTINYCKLLPPPSLWKPYGLLRYMALGFDPTVSPHYKVLYPGLGPCELVNVEIYSSETGNWNACAQADFSLTPFLMFNWRVVYWHGAIHWMSRIHVYHLSLELDEENMLQVEHHPSLYGIRYGAHDRLFVSRDCLLLVRILEEPLQINVYEMKNNSSGWSVRYHVNLQSAGNFLRDYFHVLAIVLGETEEDSFLVLQNELYILIRYNISSNTFHQLCDLTQIRLHYTQYNGFLFTPSLVGV